MENQENPVNMEHFSDTEMGIITHAMEALSYFFGVDLDELETWLLANDRRGQAH